MIIIIIHTSSTCIQPQRSSRNCIAFHLVFVSSRLIMATAMPIVRDFQHLWLLPMRTQTYTVASHNMDNIDSSPRIIEQTTMLNLIVQRFSQRSMCNMNCINLISSVFHISNLKFNTFFHLLFIDSRVFSASFIFVLVALLISIMCV